MYWYDNVDVKPQCGNCETVALVKYQREISFKLD